MTVNLDNQLRCFTLDDIIDVMRTNGIRSISIDTTVTDKAAGTPAKATVTEWFGSTTIIDDTNIEENE